ncbi:CheR family methyltransferase [Occallatibacter savannae]|uniref:CheR family methyltransferase n=1 Tax=Occallatibacter savannae TaxID=1002691 RepID=UPI000D687DE5|nr:protein-glutamate O-methyltransferase CheR [Occallatibacter savannae]
MTVVLRREEMPAWSRYIQDICGVHLDDSKGYLLETRLGSLLVEVNASSFSELVQKAKADRTTRLRNKIIEAITTNETSFFRDSAPFDLLRHKLIPDLIDKRSSNGGRVTLRIWSAACSTGQEAYSTGIVLKELLGDLSRYDIRILGTDISNKVVAHASYGEYNRLEVERGLSPDAVARHFIRSGDRWKIRDEIRAMASFRTMNLLEPFSFPTPFDIIFCRNVAIYFTDPDRTRLFQNLAKCLAKDGGLIIGATESISGFCQELEPKRYLRSVFYQRKQ